MNIKTLLLIVVSVLASNQFATAQGPELEWRLQHSGESIELNSNVGIIIPGLYQKSDSALKIRVEADKFRSSLSGDFLGYNDLSSGNGIFHLTIGAESGLSGHDKIVLLYNDTSSTLIGHIKLQIGGQAPFIDRNKTQGQLQSGAEFGPIHFTGDNFYSLIDIEAEGTDTRTGDILDHRTNKTVDINIKPNSPSFVISSSYKCSYWKFNSSTLKIEKQWTSPFATGIQVIPGNTIILDPEFNEIYRSDIIRYANNLTLKVSKPEGLVGAVNWGQLNILGNAYITSTSSITSNGQGDAILSLDFRDPRELEYGPFTVKFTTAGPSPKKYQISINILEEPRITGISNGKSDVLKYILDPTLDQRLYLEGTDLENVFLNTAHDIDELKIDFENAIYESSEFSLHINEDKTKERTYILLPVRYDYKEKSVPLGNKILISYNHPQKPQPLDSLFHIKQGNATFQADPFNDIYLNIESGSDDIHLVLNNASLDEKYGNQLLVGEVNFYNPDGTLIATSPLLNNGSHLLHMKSDLKNIVCKIGDTRNNVEDYIRPWGWMDIVIRHAGDFYKQRLDLKDELTQRVYFTKKRRVELGVAVTIPPAMLVLGEGDQLVEILPINVGGGLVFSFRKGKDDRYKKRSIEFATYLAGLNFAGKESSTDDEENRIVNKSDVAILALGQTHLRKVDGFTKTPVQFGLGYSIPGGDDKGKLFLVLGVGITFQ